MDTANKFRLNKFLCWLLKDIYVFLQIAFN